MVLHPFRMKMILQQHMPDILVILLDSSFFFLRHALDYALIIAFRLIILITRMIWYGFWCS